jgi:hypothetical protein
MISEIKIVQLFINERYDLFALLSDGRVFKKRAKGRSGQYDRWEDINLLEEIDNDLKAVNCKKTIWSR